MSKKAPEKAAKVKEKAKEKVLENYELLVDNVPAKVKIIKTPKEFVPVYHIIFPELEPATKAALESFKEKMIEDIEIKPLEVSSPEEIKKLKENFMKKTLSMLKKGLPSVSEKHMKILAGTLMHSSLGLDTIEMMLQDASLEEVVINSSREPLWVYHRRLGWLKTNVDVPSEVKIYNYAAAIGRRVGTQITNLNPLMDAYLPTGDRTNATLFPISSGGNTLTIRKFASRPWTITDFIETKTLSLEVAAFLWLAIQYELNILITGGTASGKTSFLNVLSSFIPPNHRIISIEDTREIQLPDFLHWVPMTTRPPNPEGKGEVTMLQLMINALRMRPDRVVVGEIRRAREAETLFEAIHTGHSVYSTLHANTAEETFRRLTHSPIDIPASLLSSLQLIAVMHRDRRRGIRRVLQVAELIGSGSLEEMKIELNTIFRWVPSKDTIIKWGRSHRVENDIKLYTGMDDQELQNDLKHKMEILKYMIKNGIKDVNKVGRIISEYYVDPAGTLAGIRKGNLKIVG